MPKEDLTGNWWCQLSLISDSLTLSLNEKSKLTNSNKRLWFSVIASYSPGLCLLLGGIVRKLWNWGCFQNCTIMSPAQGFCSWCWRILFSGPLGSKLSLLSILWFYHVHKSFYFRFLIWFSYSFDQTAKSLYDWLFRPFCALIFLMLIRVFASMSTFLSTFQYLCIPYHISLLSGFWCSPSAYFYELHFPSGEVSGIQLKLVGSHLACLCCLQKIRELCFLSRQYCPFFWYHCEFSVISLPHKLCLSQSTVTWVLSVSMLVLLVYFILLILIGGQIL